MQGCLHVGVCVTCSHPVNVCQCCAAFMARLCRFVGLLPCDSLTWQLTVQEHVQLNRALLCWTTLASAV